MPEVVPISFRWGSKRYYFDPKGREYEVGSAVIAETAKGLDLGIVAAKSLQVSDAEITPPLRPILRAASAEDLERDAENREHEREALAVCHQHAEQHKLPMRLVDASYTFDRKRVTFYFVSDNRVDFRGLVRDLVRKLRTRVELHQIGVRDQARLVGGFGSCGRELCCCAWLPDFKPTAIRMAKEQGLSLNPTKVSGLCGRLLCCLRYEYDTYLELRENCPARGARVATSCGKGRVTEVNLLGQSVQVELESGTREWFPVSELEGGPVRTPEPEDADEGAESVVGRAAPSARRRSRVSRAPAADVAAAPEAEASPTERPEGEAKRSSARRRPRRRSSEAKRSDAAPAAAPAPQAGPPADGVPSQAAETDGEAGQKARSSRSRRRRRRPKKSGGGAADANV